MEKLSSLLKQRSKLSDENFEKKVKIPYLKELILINILEYAEEENIEECDVSFSCNFMQRDLSLDRIIDMVSGNVEDRIFECVRQVVEFDNVKEYDEEEEELEEQDEELDEIEI